MKKIITVLIATISISSYASDCTISMWNSDGAIDVAHKKLVTQVQKIVSKKGLSLTSTVDSEFKIYFTGIEYILSEDGLTLFAPVGIVATLKSNDIKLSAKSESLMGVKFKENSRLQRLAVKTLRKVINEIPFCN